MSESGSDRDDARGESAERRPGGRRFDRNDNICFKWPQGNCPYGNRCRFIHDGPGGSSGGGGGGRGRGGGTELFLRGLDYYMTKDEVREEILRDLRCQEIILPQSRESDDQNRGFAILKFKTESDARAAMDKINGTECRGRGLFVRWSEDFPPSQWDRGYDRGFGGGGSRSNECFRWSREGRCEYGRDCRFEHSTRGSGPERPRRSGGGRYGGGGGRSDVCYAFQRDGKCSYGDSCKFIHE